MKKTLSIILVAVLLVTAILMGAFNLTASAATSGYYTYTVSSGEVTIIENGLQESNCVYGSEKESQEFIPELEYTLNDGGKSYSVTGIGNWTIPDLVIPSSYNTLPVTEIGKAAFENCTSLTSVTIPNSITRIGNTAFYGCTNLISIMIPDSVTSIDGSVFFNCTSLRSVYLTNLETWLKIDFDSVQSTPLCNGADLYLNNVLVTELIIPDSVSNIGFGAFYGCTSITTITIPNGVTSIGVSAFRNCSNLRSVYMGNGVASIGGHVFAGCARLTDVYYHGNEEEKTKITIGSNNSDLINSTWHYNSCVGSVNHTYDGACDTTCNVCGLTRIAPDHIYDNACDTTCNVCDEPRIITHTYTSECDHYCNVCGEFRKAPHKYDNACDAECNACGKKRSVPEHQYGNNKVCNICGYKNFALGDIDGTGEVDLSDVSVSAQYFAGWNVEVNEAALDCDGDGKVNLKDLVLLAQFVAGWDVVLN